MPQNKKDPDRGLDIKEEVKERLRKSLDAVQRGEEGIPIEQVEINLEEAI